MDFMNLYLREKRRNRKILNRWQWSLYIINRFEGVCRWNQCNYIHGIKWTPGIKWTT
jgi:hypothetical protein